MKTLYSILFSLTVLTATAQVPQAINYQAVARLSSGALLQNQLISVRLSVHSGTIGGTIVYQETDTATTNQYGLFTVAFGNGVPTINTFTSISWGAANTFLQVEIDTTGGSNYVSISTTQLLSVPYAQVANSLAINIGFTAIYTSDFDLLAGDSTQMQFDSVGVNDGNGFSNGTFTAPVSGLYQFNVSVIIASEGSVNGYVTMALEQNGSPIIYSALLPDGATLGFDDLLKINTVAKLSAGDVISVEVYNYNSTATSQLGAGVFPPYTYFNGYKIY